MITVEITREQKEIILNIDEDHFHDLKSKDIKPSKLTQSVSAFANASGGEIYLGIEEIDKEQKIRQWKGFKNIEEANAHLQEIERLAPLANHFDAIFLKNAEEEGLVLQLQIFKSKDIIPASNKEVYIRKGAQKLPIEGNEALNRLKLDKGIAFFEDETISIDLQEITNSTTIINFLLNVIPTAEPELWLKKQLLISKEKPTVAGIILFSDEPQAFLPKRSAIKIYRYKAKADEGERDTLAFDPISIEGEAYKLIYAAVERTIRCIEEIKKLGKTGLEKISYPHETLHEILTNAVLHRDYSITADIQVRIFDDRVEVESPGKLPGHITVKNILTEQFARNPRIVRIINKFPDPPNKDVGEGLNTAFEAMRKLRLEYPEIIEKDNSVLVIIRHQSLASPEETILQYLENHEEIVNRIGRDITGIKSENAMKSVFLRLHNLGLIEPVPGKKGPASAWRSNLKHIERHDYQKKHGWTFRISLEGKAYSKLFSDSKYGGKEKARQEAIRYRNEFLSSKLFKRTPFRMKPTTRSTTGIVGVSETYSRVVRGKRKGEKEPCFTVTWSPEVNRKKIKKFHFHHYGGREGALQAAVAFRQEKEQEILKKVQHTNE